MAIMLTGALASIVTYLLSVALYFLAALVYGIGLRPLVYGGVLEILTGILAVSLVSRERKDAPWFVVLTGIVVGRSLRGMAELPVLNKVGGMSPSSSAALVGVRILLVVLAAAATILYAHRRSQGRAA
jgi:hypothetical protein